MRPATINPLHEPSGDVAGALGLLGGIDDASLDVLEFIRAISHLYTSAGAGPVGKIVAMTGAKGGTGASTIAHNIAFSIARDLNIQTVIADMDLGFGTVGLDFNQDPAQGVAEAVFAPDRIDQNLVDRLLSKCGERLSILAAPAVLDRTYDFPETAFDFLIDILRATTPCARHSAQLDGVGKTIAHQRG